MKSHRIPLQAARHSECGSLLPLLARRLAAVGLKSSARDCSMSAFADSQSEAEVAYANCVCQSEAKNRAETVREGGHEVFYRRGLQSHAKVGQSAQYSA